MSNIVPTNGNSSAAANATMAVQAATHAGAVISVVGKGTALVATVSTGGLFAIGAGLLAGAGLVYLVSKDD